MKYNGKTLKFMTRKELAAMAGVSERTFERWLKENKDNIKGLSEWGRRLLSPALVKEILDYFCIDY